MTPLVYFVRHGETDWNAEGRLQGQADTDINALGRGQADRNGRRLAALIADASAFDFVASPMRRTRETMERIRHAMGLDPHGYRLEPRLIEVHFGGWQGRTFAEIEADEPGADQDTPPRQVELPPAGRGGRELRHAGGAGDAVAGRGDAADRLRHPWRRAAGAVPRRRRLERARGGSDGRPAGPYPEARGGPARLALRRPAYCEISMSVMRFSPPTSS